MPAVIQPLPSLQRAVATLQPRSHLCGVVTACPGNGFVRTAMRHNSLLLRLPAIRRHLVVCKPSRQQASSELQTFVPSELRLQSLSPKGIKFTSSCEVCAVTCEHHRL